MLVVIGIIGMLAALLSTAILYARRRALSVSCQNNLQQIGTTVLDLAQSHGGLYPNLLNAYPNPNAPNDSGFPWWARVYQQMEPDQQGGLGLLYVKNASGIYGTYGPVSALNPNGHVLTGQLPPTFANLFHCRMAGGLDRSSAANLFNSISYGINFDVKLANGTPYACVPATAPNYPALANPPGSDLPTYTAAQDMDPDPLYMSDMLNPGGFILVSEANTQDPNPANWTGGRIAMQATEGLSANFYHPARIVGRHDGRANILYGDLHVASLEAVSGGTLTNNVNVNTPLWTLPGQ